MSTFITPQKQRALNFIDRFPTLHAAANTMTVSQLEARANKEFRLSSSAKKNQRTVELILTAAKRHFNNEENVGLEALRSLLNSEGKEVLACDVILAQKEWANLIELYEEALVESPKGVEALSSSESPIRKFVANAVGLEPFFEVASRTMVERLSPKLLHFVTEESGMTKEQITRRSNAEFLCVNPSKANASEGLLLTAAKRHIGNTERQGFEAFAALLTSQGKSALSGIVATTAGPSLVAEWQELVLAVETEMSELAAAGASPLKSNVQPKVLEAEFIATKAEELAKTRHFREAQKPDVKGLDSDSTGGSSRYSSAAGAVVVLLAVAAGVGLLP